MPRQAYGEACRLNLEGLVSKRKDAPYVSRRDTSWIKSKCLGRSEFVIGGFRPVRQGRPRLRVACFLANTRPRASSIAAVSAPASIRSCSPISDRNSNPASIATSPFREVPRDIRAAARWVKPDLVAEIAYTELTGDGHLRHPAFIALRDDKKASDVTGADRGGPT